MIISIATVITNINSTSFFRHSRYSDKYLEVTNNHNTLQTSAKHEISYSMQMKYGCYSFMPTVACESLEH